MDTPLTTREIRNLYVTAKNLQVLYDSDIPDYVRWLESRLAESNFNSIEGIEKVVEFKDTCHLCEKPTYSQKHQICKNPACFCYVLKDPMQG